MSLDAAEHDGPRCFAAHVTRPVKLAHACADRGIPFVTFSSDLIFDGEKHHPYVEDDPPAPLNVFGACEAEPERRVRDRLSSALIIRTSAPFDPWSECTFVGRLLRALVRGETLHVPNGCVMSPTYVPDLVHATLDLLIDGEHGVWHVANEGSTSMFDLARAIARCTGHALGAIL